MDIYQLAELAVTSSEGIATRLAFDSAKLVVVTETGSRLWYIDVDGVKQTALLQQFHEREDIRVELSGITAGGKPVAGIGYLHPNAAHAAAAIRGDGELPGF